MMGSGVYQKPTTTPAAGAVPKAGGGGTLADGWLSEAIPRLGASGRLADTVFSFPLLAGLPLIEYEEVVTRHFALGSGNNVIYTCPPGKKCLYFCPTIHNPTGAGISIFGQLNVGADFYRASGNATVNAGVSNTPGAFQGLGIGLLLSEGESYAINASAGGLFAANCAYEFDADYPIHQSRIYSMTAGYTPLLTCPTGKRLRIITIGPLGGLISFGQIHFSNTSGGTIVFKASLVPPAGTPSSANQVAGLSVLNNSTGTLMNPPRTLEAGESIHILSTSNNAGQVGLINYIEEDA